MLTREYVWQKEIYSDNDAFAESKTWPSCISSRDRQCFSACLWLQIIQHINKNLESKGKTEPKLYFNLTNGRREGEMYVMN